MMKRAIQSAAMLTLFFTLFPIIMYGQYAFTSSGGDAMGSGGILHYSVGQVAFSSVTSISGSVTEGVQQPYEIMTVTGNPEFQGVRINLSAFPNPAVDKLFITVENTENLSLRYVLYDNGGRLLLTDLLKGSITEIPINGFPPAAYSLVVFSDSDRIKTFQIIKHP